MPSTTEQFNVICKTNLDAMRHFAVLSLEDAEKMFKLPLRMTREIVEKDGGTLDASWVNNHIANALAEWSNVYERNTQKIVELTKTYFETANQAQSELMRFVQDEMGSMNKNILDPAQQTSDTEAVAANRDAVEVAKSKPTTKRLAA